MKRYLVYVSEQYNQKQYFISNLNKETISLIVKSLLENFIDDTYEIKFNENLAGGTIHKNPTQFKFWVDEIEEFSTDKKNYAFSTCKKKVYVDMDDTICDFSGRFIEHIKTEPGIQWPQSQYGFFLNLEPLPGAVEAVKELEKHYDVYILTRPSVLNPLCYTEKRVWIEKHFGLYMCHKLMLVPDKTMVPGDYLIDDADWREFNGEHIWFRTEKFPNWEAVLRYLIVSSIPAY